MGNQYKHPEFNEWVWKSFSNMSKVLDLEKFVKINYDRGRTFHVGTDSQIKGRKTTFATAVVAHYHSMGGEIAISTYRDSMPYSALRTRLIAEAMRTLEVAWYLDGILPEDAKLRLHVDVNDDFKFKSGQYKEQVVGMIMAQGYISYREIEKKREPIEDFQKVVFWKPDSWAATKVADKHTKN